jgi:hypothetical protein
LTEKSAFCALPQQATVSKAAMYCLPKQRKLPFARVLTGATGVDPGLYTPRNRDPARRHRLIVTTNLCLFIVRCAP